ncbi:hypothetical protein APED_12350 [Acanthopleuribacter pedis]
MKTAPTIALLLLLCCSCQTEPASTRKGSQLFSDVTSFIDILEFEDVFPLEQNDHAMFEAPNTVVMTHSGFLMTNDRGTKILRYHRDGGFDRTVAPNGSGPGEVQRIAFGTRIFDNRVAFWDLYKGAILVFEPDGTFVFDLNINAKLNPHQMNATGASFAWPEPDTLILGNVTSQKQPDIQAVALKVDWDTPKRVRGVALDRVLSLKDTNHEAIFGSKINTTLTQVGDHFWLGSAHFSSFARLNPYEKGKPTPYQAIKFPQALTPKDYEAIEPTDHKARFTLINSKGTIFNIMAFDHLVFVQVGVMGFVPFDTSGRQLENQRIICRISRLVDTYQGLVMFVTPRKNIGNLERLFKVNLFEDSPHDLGDDDQPYVVLMRLRKKFQAP